MVLVNGYGENKCKELLVCLKNGKRITKESYNKFIKNVECDLEKARTFLMNSNVEDLDSV